MAPDDNPETHDRPDNPGVKKRQIARMLGKIIEVFLVHDYDLIEITGISRPAEERHPEWKACQK